MPGWVGGGIASKPLVSIKETLFGMLEMAFVELAAGGDGFLRTTAVFLPAVDVEQQQRQWKRRTRDHKQENQALDLG